MMIKALDIKYPVILLNIEYNTFEVIENNEQLTTTTKLGLINESVLNNIVIDQDGNFYKTVSAKKVKNFYPFWRFEFFNPLVKIDIDLQQIEPSLSLDYLKLKLVSYLKSGYKFDESTNILIQQANTIHDMMQSIR